MAWWNPFPNIGHTSNDFLWSRVFERNINDERLVAGIYLNSWKRFQISRSRQYQFEAFSQHHADSKSNVWSFETIRFVPLSQLCASSEPLEQYRAIKQYFYLIFALCGRNQRREWGWTTREKKKQENTENEMGKRKNKRNIRQPERSGVESNATKTRSSRRREKRDGFYLEWPRQRYQVARLRELCSAERVLTSAFLQIHDLLECFCRSITVAR